MAAYTSTQSGNWNESATWGGGGTPGDGDTAIVASGHTVTVTASVTVGATTGTAHGIQINGASSSSYGKLIVNSGVTLTLRGVSQTYLAMLVQRYGQFAPAGGSTIVVSCTSDYQTGIKCDGILDAQGSLGNLITFTVPFADDWTGHTTDIASETKSGSGDYYLGNVRCRALTNRWVTNSAKTGIGTGVSTSFSIISSTPAGLCTTQVASLAAVDSAGDFYLDHDAGVIYFYTASTGTSITYSYTHLKNLTADWRGWGIWISNNNDYCKGLFDYCVFEHMGGIGVSYYVSGITTTDTALLLANRKTESVAANRSAYVKHSTFRYNGGAHLQFQSCVGSGGDEILAQYNEFYDIKTGSRFLAGIHLVLASVTTVVHNEYIKIDQNVFNFGGKLCINIAYGCKYVSVTANTGTMGGGFFTFGTLSSFAYGAQADDAYMSALYPATAIRIAENVLVGRASLFDARTLAVRGESAAWSVVEDNHFMLGNRMGSQDGSYVIYRRNRFGFYYHHGMTGPVADDHYTTDIIWENNLFYADPTLNNLYGSPWIETGYNHRTCMNNVVIRNNVVKGGMALLGLGDIQDSGNYALVTNLVAVNNIISAPNYAVRRDTAGVIKIHAKELDYWLTHSLGTAFATGMTNNTKLSNFWKGGGKYNRIAAGSRNVPFAALYDGSYTTNQGTGRSLVHTVNTIGQDQTLAWGGGATQQLIIDYGTSAGVSKRTLTCIGKSWTLNNIRQRWMYVVSGTGAGQARCILNSAAYGAYAVTIESGGTGYSVGQFIYTSGGTSTYVVILEVTAVSGGVITGIKIHSGGLFSVTPSNPVATTRLTGSSGSGCTLNLTWGPTLLFVPDLTTALDDTSVFAIVESEVRCYDSGAVDSVRVGIYGPDFSTSSGTDSDITVTVDKTVDGDPKFAGSSWPSSNADDYKTASDGAGVNAGTADDAADQDYWETARPQGSADDIGLYEYPAVAFAPWLFGFPLPFLQTYMR